MLLKVCGMREAHNISDIESLGIDWMGFIFYPPSSRYVSEVPSYLPSRAKRVGVFVDAEIDFIRERIESFDLDYVQLHGKETPEFCTTLKAQFPTIGIIKVFSIKDAQSLADTALYEGLANYFLFDTFCKEKGGSGRTFDHSLLADYKGHTPFLLSGGLSLDNAREIMHFSHPMLAGYDLNSRFETAPALKDTALIREFITLTTQ